MATTQEALQVSTIVPSLTVNDLQKSIKFYEALGFVVDERWEDNGTLLGVMMRAGKSQIGLNQDDWKKGRDRKKGVGMRVFMSTTQNVDEIATRAKSAGVALGFRTARHRMEEPRVRGHRSERLRADDFIGEALAN